MAIINDPQLLAYLQSEEMNAVDTSINDQVAAAISFYQGQPFGNEVEGRSQLVTRDVAEACDYMITSILGTVISGDQIIAIEAKDSDNAEACEDATEIIHQQFMRGQDGYLLLHDWIKAGLLEKNGVVKTWVDRRFERVELEVPIEAITEIEPGKLMIDDMEVIESEHINADEVMDDGYGALVAAPAIMRAKVKRPLPPKFRDALVPTEQFRASADARSLETANYRCNMVPLSLSDLRKMGFEFEDAELWDDNPQGWAISDARDADKSLKDRDVYHRGAMRRVWLKEEYTYWDQDGDGIAEAILVHRVGTRILAVETLDQDDDDHPYEEWTPFPMTARRVGQSLADKVMDVQVVRSTLLRQGMDSLYMSTNPRTLVNEQSLSENTIDDLLTVRSGALIRWMGSVPPTPWATLPVHEQAFQGMQMMAEEMQGRTGITPLNQGIDADAFNRTATGTALLQSQGQQIELYVARNFVEAFARLALKKYRLMRKYGQPIPIMVDGQAKTIDPRTWPEDIDVRIKVGLGTGNKDKKIAALSNIVQSQTEALQQGLPIVTIDNLYNATRSLVTELQVGNPSDFVTKPPEPETGPDGKPAPQPPKPDPEVIKAQTEQMKTQAEMQMKGQKQEAEIEMDRQAAAAKIAIADAAAAEESRLRRDRAVEEARLAQERADFEKQLALDNQLFNQSLAKRNAAAKASQDAATVPGYRDGGDLSE